MLEARQLPFLAIIGVDDVDFPENAGRAHWHLQRTLGVAKH